MTEELRNQIQTKEEDDSDDIAKQHKRLNECQNLIWIWGSLLHLQRPDRENDISCDGCKEWFHFRCMKLGSWASRLIARFSANREWKVWRNKVETKMIKGCLSPGFVTEKELRNIAATKRCTNSWDMSSSKFYLTDIKAILMVENVDQFHTGNLILEFRLKSTTREVTTYHSSQKMCKTMKQLQGKT